MLDYLLGDDGRQQDEFGDTLCDKYDSVGMTIDLKFIFKRGNDFRLLSSPTALRALFLQ